MAGHDALGSLDLGPYRRLPQSGTSRLTGR